MATSGTVGNSTYTKPVDAEGVDIAILNQNFDNFAGEVNKSVRTDGPYAHAGLTAGFQATVGTDVAMVISAAQVLQGGFTFETASAGRLVIPKTGRYLVKARIYATNGSGYKYTGGAYLNSVAIPSCASAFWKADGSDYFQTVTSEEHFNAGDKIGLGATCAGASASTWGTTGYNGSFLELTYIGA